MDKRIIKFTFSRIRLISLAYIILSLLIDYINYLPIMKTGAHVGSFSEFYISQRSSGPLYLLTILLPPIIFSWLFYVDRKKFNINNIVSRVGYINYRRSYYISILLITFFTVLVYNFLALGLAYGMKGHMIVNSTYDSRQALADLYYNNPVLFCSFAAVWESFCQTLYVSLATILSFFIDSFFIIAFAPLMYRYLVDFIANLSVNYYHYISMIFAQRFFNFLSEDGYLIKVLSAICIFIVFQILIFIIFKRREANDLVV